MIVCNDCDLSYEVVWNNDGMEPPTMYCPRCGSQVLKIEEEYEDGDDDD